MSEVEICVDSLESAINAAAGGCSRLELCSALSEGGLTPTPALLKAVKQLTSTPVFCMVRCRGGPMVYSDEEKKLMVAEAADLVAAGADGLVFGALTSLAAIDEDVCKEIKKIAGSLPCTFHRAFDVLPDSLQQLETIIALGYTRLLTSGCAASAVAGAALIGRLVGAAGARCTVMAGAGVKSSNVTRLITDTRVTSVHASARLARSCPAVAGLNMGSADDSVMHVTDQDEVQALVQAAAAAVKALGSS